MIAYFLLFALVFAAEDASGSDDIECKTDKYAQLTKDEKSCECMTGFTAKSGTKDEDLECECTGNKEVVEFKENNKQVKKCVDKCGENQDRDANKNCKCKDGFENKAAKDKPLKCEKKANNGVNGIFAILAVVLYFLF